MTLDNLEPCPFCGGTDVDGRRFDHGFMRYSDHGDFRLECRCGCCLEKSVHELVSRFVKENGTDIECTEEDLWNLMAEEWNERC